MRVHLHGLGTALPSNELPQEAVRDLAEEVLAPQYPEFGRLRSTFATSGVERRYSVVPRDWFLEGRGWSERNDAYLEGATALFIEAARRALESSGWAADEVDCIVTVSSTGVATPTLEARAMTDMGFRRDVRRVPVFGLGCAGGVSGLSIAQSLSAAMPGDRILLVVVEACSLSFRNDRLQKADIIATVLFGDGAAAACLSGRPCAGQTITLDPGAQITWPDTLGIMGWDVDDAALGVVFDRSIPDFIDAHFAEAATEALAACGMVREDVDRFVCHPGGAKVVTAIERALRLEQGVLIAERDVLRDAGNMSAPTVLFVLDKVVASGESGRMMTAALGPGFTGSFLPITVDAA